MDSFKDVLEAAQAYCKTQMAEPTYNLYIDGLEPISFEDSSHITLSVRNDFICKIVTDRYLGLLKEAFKTVLGFDVDITLVVPSTPPHEVVLAQQYEANPASPQGNYEFTFENFIKGPSNQFAFAAAQAVAANPSGAYNPLFIYGGSGLGKTHLLTAIQTEIKRTHPDFVIMYVTCEQFTNELIAAIRAGSTEDFRMKYRVADLLLVDDIQFIAGKERTQEEFFHTFNTLREAKKQVIISSDRPPKDFETLEDRLKSRFTNGLLVDISPPNYETRMAILHKKGEIEGYNIDMDVLEYIATNIKSNIRELEGSLTKLVAFSKFSKKPINVSLAEEVLRDFISPNAHREVTPELIIQTVAEHYQISVEDLISKKRDQKIAWPRQIAMYLCRSLTDIPLTKIGSYLGDRDHTTVSHGCDKVAETLAKDASFANTLEIIKKKINPS